MTDASAADLPTFSDSVVIARPPGDLYEMVSDVTRMGAWSPVCRSCWWDEGHSAYVGAWFNGRNEEGDRSWETRSEVVVADPGREFAFVVGGSYVRWGYTFTPVDGGTEVTESWEVLPDLLDVFTDHYGDEADAQLQHRIEAAHAGIPATLAAIKRSAEAG